MAIGQKFDSFYYFEEFTDTIKFLCVVINVLKSVKFNGVVVLMG